MRPRRRTSSPPSSPPSARPVGSRPLKASTCRSPSLRTSDFLQHPVFNTHRSETQLLRYIRRLSDRDLALDRTMIPLGSCTMKLNATAEMEAISWPEFASIHPFAPESQTAGWRELIEDLEAQLTEITGYDQVSIQPNAGSQGELAGPAGDPRLPPLPRRCPAHRLPDPGLRARHQRGLGRAGRHEGRGGGHGFGRHDRPRGPAPPRSSCTRTRCPAS